MSELLIDKLLLCGEGEQTQIIRDPELREFEPDILRLLSIELVVGQLADQRLKSPVLKLAERDSGERFNRAIIELDFSRFRAHRISKLSRRVQDQRERYDRCSYSPQDPRAES